MSLDWKTVSFTMLPHQVEDIKRLVESLSGPQDLVLVMLPDQWDAFLRAATKLARLKHIRAAGSAIAFLTQVALTEAGKEIVKQVEAGATQEV